MNFLYFIKILLKVCQMYAKIRLVSFNEKALLMFAIALSLMVYTLAIIQMNKVVFVCSIRVFRTSN
jgi:hypothetical protein